LSKSDTYTYDAENRLVSAVRTNRSASGTETVITTLAYYPAGRLHGARACGYTRASST
jgi:hypothetical protein